MTTPATASEPALDRVVIVGAEPTAVRLVEELDRSGEKLTVLGLESASPSTLAELTALPVEFVTAVRVGERELRAVHVERAKAVVILGSDDVAVVRIALAVEELNPHARLVLELSNPNLGEKLAPLLGDCTVLSTAELAAPAFVAAALATADTLSFELAGRAVVAGPRARVAGEVLAVLGDSTRSGIAAVLPESGDVVLGTELVGKAPSTVQRSGLRGTLSYVFDRRIRLVLIGLVSLIVLSTLYFHADGQSWVTSLYLALSASTATGAGDFESLSSSYQFGALAIQIFGLVLSSGITAVIVDALLSSRLAAISGGVRGRPRHHVVVCGLGRIGTSVATQLRQRRVPVVAIERQEDSIGVLRARQLKIPVIIAAASDQAAQEAAGIARADAVLAVTDDEAVNLEIGLVAKQVNPGVRVVTRVFDHDLATRVERRLELGATRSVAMLAAPAFAAAALARRSEVIFPIGRRVVLFTELSVPADSPLIGQSLRRLDEAGALQVLAHGPVGQAWSWQPGDPALQVDDRVGVVATRAGLARLLLRLRRRRGGSVAATADAAEK